MKTNNQYQSFLATSSKKFLKVGFAIAIFSTIVAFSLPIYEHEKDYYTLVSPIEDAFEIEETFLYKEKIYVPEHVEEKKIAEVFDIKTADFIEEKKKETFEDKITDIDDLDKGFINLTDEIIIEKEIAKPTRFAEVMPEFPGGENSLLSYLATASYCAEAIDMDKEGKVIIQFVVNEKGEIINAEVVKSLYPCLDQAALDVVQNMPNWTPGKQGFQTVPVIMTAPFNFELH